MMAQYRVRFFNYVSAAGRATTKCPIRPLIKETLSYLYSDLFIANKMNTEKTKHRNKRLR